MQENLSYKKERFVSGYQANMFYESLIEKNLKAYLFDDDDGFFVVTWYENEELPNN